MSIITDLLERRTGVNISLFTHRMLYFNCHSLMLYFNCHLLILNVVIMSHVSFVARHIIMCADTTRTDYINGLFNAFYGNVLTLFKMMYRFYE